MFLVGPIFLLAICAASYRWISSVAYKKGLNEYAFGALGVAATIIAGGLSYFAAAALDTSNAANSQMTGTILGGVFFIPMDLLYLTAVHFVIKFCPADAGDVALAVHENRARIEAQRQQAAEDEANGTGGAQ